MKPVRASRKRALDDENSDPCRFLQAYYSERGIPESPEDDAVLLDDCVRRAELARESFKRWRAADYGTDVSPRESESVTRAPSERTDQMALPAEAALARLREEDGPFSCLDEAPPVNVSLLTPHEKYQRRLDNNRRSAAASRVFQEVLRREHTHALRNVCDERNRLKTDVERLQESLRKLRDENERLAESEMAAEMNKSLKNESSLLESPLDSLIGSAQKPAQSTFATVTAAAFLPVVSSATTEETVANLSRALFPMLGSQTQSQDDADDKNCLVRHPGPPLNIGILNSQASQGDSFLALRCGSGPGVFDDIGETSDIFTGSQLGASQLLASQGSGTGSQGSACQGLNLSQVLGLSQGPSFSIGLPSQGASLVG